MRAARTSLANLIRRGGPAQLASAHHGESDGRTLFFSDIAFASDTGGTYRIARVATDGASSPEDLFGLDGRIDDAAISPDGRWILIAATESGRREIVVRSCPDVRRVRRQISSAGGRSPRWTRNGREIVFAEGDRIMAAAFDPASGTAVVPTPLFRVPQLRGAFDVTADGDRFLVIQRPGEPAAAERQHVVVIVNWLQSLSRRIGAGAP